MLRHLPGCGKLRRRLAPRSPQRDTGGDRDRGIASVRIFRYWTRYTTTLDESGVRQDVSCYGGSDESIADATRDAEQRLVAVRARMRGQPENPDDYEADIREELIERLDAANAVTRTRYGALVLNSADHLFIDIDEPRYRFWEGWFGRPDLARRKQRIIANIEQRARQADCAGLGLRVYETHKGIRVIVSGRRIDPRSPQTTRFMRSFNADWLYTTLCRKQACYRARLTPKPYRMKLRAHRVTYPRNTQQEAAFRAWLPGYESASERYATCRFVRAIGVDARSPIIEYHDRVSGAQSSRPLA